MLLLGYVTGGLVAVLSLLALYIRWAWSDYYRKGAKLPGPRPLPLLGNLVDVMRSKNPLQYLADMTFEYKGFAAIWQANTLIVLVSKPEYMQTFFESSMIDKPPQYDTLAEILGFNGIFCGKGNTWKTCRKQLMKSFNTMPMERLMSNFTWVNGFLVRYLTPRADGRIFKGFLAFRLAMAHAIIRNSLDVSETDDFLTDMIEHDVEFAQRTATLRQFNLIERYDWSFSFLAKSRRYYQSIGNMREWFTQLIRKKTADYQRLKANNEVIPNIWIYNMLEKFPERTEYGLCEDMINIFITGFDTTSGSLGYALIILGLHPEMQEKIYQEDKEVQAHVRGRDMTYDDLQMYEYTDRFLRENLRLFPIGEFLGRITYEDIYFGEHLVPKNTTILAMSMCTFRDPEVFKDPLRCDPDRFLPENLKKIHPYGYNAFGAGARSCPGNRYALAALKCFLPTIVRNFTIGTEYTSIKEAMDNAVADATLNDSRYYPISLKPRIK